jgi:dTDP-glucose pyrophosphorylase
MIVIPMAGFSRRFTNAGYKQPKFMLNLAGRPAFDWAVLSFSELFASDVFLFVFRRDDATEAFIKGRLSELGISKNILVGLTEPTRGQAETVALGLAECDAADSERITIFNIDTFRPGFRYPSAAILEASGFLETFEASGENWSFCATAENDQTFVTHVTEKQRISSHCSTGLYHFASRTLFENAYRYYRTINLPEMYVAPIYNRLIELGLTVRRVAVPENKLFLCGTPAEYEELKSREYILTSAFSGA